MLWPWVTRKTLVTERIAALHREDEARRHGSQLARAARHEERGRADDILTASLLPFVQRWIRADARMRGERVAVTIEVHAQTIHEIARDPSIAEYLGKTLGGQFAAELKSLRLVEIPSDGTARRLW